MKISVLGLGYVGCVSLACLAELGHDMIGCDIIESKVSLINNGKATIVEKDIDKLIEQGVTCGRIRATLSVQDAVLNSDIAILCVGTPNDENGNLNLSHIFNVIEQISEAIVSKESFFTIAIRSTVPMGTNETAAALIEKISKKRKNKDFGVVSNPEFLREGSAVQDFFNPPYTVIASESSEAIKNMKKVYEKINVEIIEVDIPTAELIKFVNNSWHALKVAFGNEIGRICKKIGADSISLMDLFSKDTQLNISKTYLRPGFAYGGSCLPKDLKALNTLAHDNYISTPILNAIDKSNTDHIEHALSLIYLTSKNKIGFYGLSFKAGTDDLRFSPALELAERLLGKGFEVFIYDHNINISKIMGKNKELLFERLPHIEKILLPSFEEMKDKSDVIVIINVEKNDSNSFNGKLILDFSGNLKGKVKKNYIGIAW